MPAMSLWRTYVILVVKVAPTISFYWDGTTSHREYGVTCSSRPQRRSTRRSASISRRPVSWHRGPMMRLSAASSRSSASSVQLPTGCAAISLAIVRLGGCSSPSTPFLARCCLPPTCRLKLKLCILKFVWLSTRQQFSATVRTIRVHLDRSPWQRTNARQSHSWIFYRGIVVRRHSEPR